MQLACRRPQGYVRDPGLAVLRPEGAGGTEGTVDRLDQLLSSLSLGGRD